MEDVGKIIIFIAISAYNINTIVYVLIFKKFQIFGKVKTDKIKKYWWIDIKNMPFR
jgi:hypothetical protein